MKVRIWGAQGSMPTPLQPEAVTEKIIQAILQMPDLDTRDPETVRAYVQGLPPLLRGTAKGNTSCVEVQAGGEIFIIDAGTGIRALGLELLKGPCGRGQGNLHLLFSHPHWDHIHGFPLFLPAFIPGNRITIYSIHDLELALTEQQRYLFFPVSINSVQAERELAQLDPAIRQRYPKIVAMQAKMDFVRLKAGKPFSIGQVTINTSRNHHPGDAYSYRLADQHSIFVYGGDAEYQNLDADTFQKRVDFFKNADAVLFDAQYGLRDSWENKVDFGHSSAMIGVDFARRAGVRTLLLTHHEPTYSDQQLQEIQDTAVAYQAQDPSLPTCEILIAYEGLELDLAPPGAVGVELVADEETAVLTPGSLFDEKGVNQLLLQLADVTHTDAPVGSIVDLSQVELLTTASLKTLVSYSWQLDGNPLVLAAPSEMVAEVIKLGGYGDYFAIYPTVDEAIKAVRARELLNLPGQVIDDRYRILDTLSNDVLVTILHVFDQSNQREAALRIISPAFGTDTIGRFLEQMSLLAGLDHPHIAQVFASNLDQASNRVFIVEELFTGPTLYDLLQEETPWTIEQALELVQKLTEALGHAHSRGVIHSNLKPRDIFVGEQGVKIGGFNLGRLEEGRKMLSAPVVYLNPSYLTPEQILGRPLDARTDLYALGILMYQLFTGQLPFDGDDDEVMQAHLEQAPTPPRHLNPDLSRSIEHLILKLLSKNPNDRYASAQQARRIASSLTVGSGETGHSRGRQLIGRTGQLQTLRARWQEVSAGRGQLAFISGEPGIGKTSLARQFAHLSEAPVILEGQCQEQDGRPAYHPFAQALQAYFATVPPELANPEVRRWLSHCDQIAPNLKQLVPDLPEPAELEPKQAQLRLMSSLTQFIKVATQKRPWFLLLDDLQWIDEGSVELLRYLSRHVPEMSLMIVGTYRDLEIDSEHAMQTILRDLSQTPTCLQLSLDRLDETDVARLLAQLWAPEVPGSLTKTIYQHTAGNPLYAEEVAKGLEDDGLVRLHKGDWIFPDAAQVRLPQSVYDAVERRIHYLNAETRDVLAEAAVLGQTFRFVDLVALSGLSEWTVLDHLDVALERQLVHEVNGGESLRFQHGEIHHVIYDDLGALRRRRLHRRAGEVIEQRAQPDPENMADELAHHYEAAGEIERALTYSIPAAEQARAAYANEAALEWYERTLQMLNLLKRTNDTQFVSLWLTAHRSMGEISTVIGKYDEALVQYASARDLLENHSQLPDRSRRLANLCRLTAFVYERKSHHDLALQWIENGLNALSAQDTSLEKAQLYLLRAGIYHRQTENEEALSWCELTIDAATHIGTQDSQLLKAQTLYLKGAIYKQYGDLNRAIQMCKESVGHYLKFDDFVGQSRAYNNLGNVYFDLGNWDQALESYKRSYQINGELGDIYGQGMLANNIASIHLNRGEWAKANDLYKQSYTIWKRIGSTRAEAATLINLARTHFHNSNWTGVHTCLSASEALFSEIGAREFLPELERLWGKFYLVSAEFEQAQDHARLSTNLAIELGDRLEEGVSRRVLGQVHQAVNDGYHAEEEIRRSLSILSELGSDYQVAKTRLALASLLFERGNPDEAHDKLKQAIETFLQLGAKADLAEARKLAATVSNQKPNDK